MTSFACYLLLAIAVLLSLREYRMWAGVFLVAAGGVGFASDRVTVVGCGLLALLALLLTIAVRSPGSVTRVLSGVSATALAFLLMDHLAPGFHNLLLLDKIRFSADAVPFRMYLNFDKVAAAVLIACLALDERRLFEVSLFDLRRVGALFGVLILLMVTLVGITGYAKFEPKFPDTSWIWLANNLVFVCFSEELIFRGLVQGGLAKRMSNRWLPVAVGALIFGASHYHGGIGYIALATIAGLFYGTAYLWTGKIRGPILLHFAFNCTHFFFFTYPALA